MCSFGFVGQQAQSEQFFTESQLRELLPKKPTKAALAIQEEALSVMVRLEDCGGDNLARETILREMLAVMRRAVVCDGGAILTLDALITLDDDGNEVVVDQTIVHHTAKSHLPSSARWFLANQCMGIGFGCSSSKHEAYFWTSGCAREFQGGQV